MTADELSILMGTGPEQTEAIWEEFFPRLIRLAKKKLCDVPKRDFDEEDVALSALNSFFRGHREGKFDRLNSRDEMWRLLATITARKATARRRHMNADKRGGGAVRGESVFFRVGSEDSNLPGLAAFRDENKLPETTEEILRTCDDLLSRLPDEKHRQTAILRLSGYTNDEIAAEVGGSVARTKQRLQRIREVWNDSKEET